MLGFAILLLFNLLGLAANRAGVPLPGPVIGLLLLTLALFTNLVKLPWIEDTASFLLTHMTLFFTPVIVGVLPLLSEIHAELAPILITLVGSLLAVMLTTGFATKILLPPAAPEAAHAS